MEDRFMELITVDELDSFTENTNSTETHKQLTGFISIVSTEGELFDRGTILLNDKPDNSTVSYVCLVDRYLPDVTNSKVFIRQWSYIYNEEKGKYYLEFEMDSVYVTFSQTQSVLRDSILEDNCNFRPLIKKYKIFYTPEYLPPQPMTVSAHLVGKVSAISMLYVQPNSVAKFFLQLTTAPEQKEKTIISIIFRGNDLIKYYKYFRIGCFYIFQHMDWFPKTIPNEQNVFVFSNTRSACQIITLSQYEVVLSIAAAAAAAATSTPNEEIEQPQPTVTAKAKKPLVYTGYITRVIDCQFGIYELDNHIQLCLSHYLAYYSDTPFRCNTKLKISYYHIAEITTERQDQPSLLLTSLWDTSSNMFIVGCTKTHVEILAMPPQQQDIEMSHSQSYSHSESPANDPVFQIKELIYDNIWNKRSTFSQMMRQLEIYAVLQSKFVGLDIHSFIKAHEIIGDYLFELTNTPIQRSKGHWINDFFHHESVCSTVGSKDVRKAKISVTLDTFLFLDQLKSLLVKDLKEYRLDLAGGNRAYEQGNVDVKTNSFDYSANYCVIGQVDMKDDGRIYLMDSSNTQILLLTPPATADIQLGSIYLIKGAQFFQEDISFQDKETEKKYTLDVTYLSCEAKDLLLVTPQEQPFTFVMNHAPLGLGCTQSFFTNDEADDLLGDRKDYSVIYVTNIGSIRTRFDMDGTISLECRVIVILYYVGNDRKLVPMHSTFILDSQGKSLEFVKKLQVDQWYVLYGARYGEDIVTPKGDPPAWHLKADLYKIYPIHFDFSSNFDKNKTVTLKPIMDGNDELYIDDDDPRSKIYTVKQFALESQIPHPLFLVKSSNWFYFQSINVRGIVIGKKFTDSFDQAGLGDKYAKQLHHSLGIGSGKPNRKLMIQLRQADTLDTINIYANIEQVHFPLGVVCGATVTFRNLIRKTQKKHDFKFHCNTDGFTTIQVETTRPAQGIESLQNEDIETKCLSQLLQPQQQPQPQEEGEGDRAEDKSREEEDKMFKVCCQVTSIIQLQLKYQCKDCGSVVRDNECYGQCKFASRILITSAYIQIDDGTACCNANVDGERLVFRLLQLKPNQMESLRKIVSKYGEISYGGWGKSTITTLDDSTDSDYITMNGLTLEDICSKAKQVGNIWIYGKIQQQNSKKRKWRFFEDGVENVDLGGSLEEKFNLRAFTISDKNHLMNTMERQKLKIKVVEIENINPLLMGFTLLQQQERSVAIMEES